MKYLRCKVLFFFCFMFASCLPAHANASSPVTAPVSSLMSVAQVVLALGFVVALIVFSAWLVRRLSLIPMGAKGQVLKVVTGVMVGAKERVVVVEVEGRWLVLGVTASSVNLLHSLDAPEQVETVVPQAFSQQFSAKLAAALQRTPR
ncbi:flagellar biosynthetic protein FliO [Iodobacter sp. CM08]|uniref:flagellar biosynthetic protein FliO n=1 Tax=Iodobacter sp. CM08 TaxID=3085902 RepID=UPI002982B674|nr:flagellar biosynthetic protein FliO [Iodobacter sp. CM08]MDW5416871.1 flagellar biosynthetic protein FliO [Iodobacter sp. CM08]